jgi:hypothetical protein
VLVAFGASSTSKVLAKAMIGDKGDNLPFIRALKNTKLAIQMNVIYTIPCSWMPMTQSLNDIHGQPRIHKKRQKLITQKGQLRQMPIKCTDKILYRP